MPDWHYCETVHVYNDAGQYVRGFIDGHPPVDPDAPVPVRVPTGDDGTWAVVMRPRAEVYDFDLGRWVEGRKGRN